MSSTPVDKPEEFLTESGLLFHINRSILHPLGLSLSMDVETQGNTEVIKSNFVLHRTDHPAGFVLPESEFVQAQDKYDRYLTENRHKVLTRGKQLGYIIQEK